MADDVRSDYEARCKERLEATDWVSGKGSHEDLSPIDDAFWANMPGHIKLQASFDLSRDAYSITEEDLSTPFTGVRRWPKKVS